MKGMPFLPWQTQGYWRYMDPLAEADREGAAPVAAPSGLNTAVVAFVLGLATATAFVVTKEHFDATRRSRGGQYSAIVTPAAIRGVYHTSQPTVAHRVQVSV